MPQSSASVKRGRAAPVIGHSSLNDEVTPIGMLRVKCTTAMLLPRTGIGPVICALLIPALHLLPESVPGFNGLVPGPCAILSAGFMEIHSVVFA